MTWEFIRAANYNGIKTGAEQKQFYRFKNPNDPSYPKMIELFSRVPILLYLLAFAAGAMLYVVVEKLIPEMSEGEQSNIGTIFFSLGFTLMMLDVALG